MDEEDGGFGVAPVSQPIDLGGIMCGMIGKVGFISVGKVNGPRGNNGWAGTGAIQETRLTGRPCLHPSS